MVVEGHCVVFKISIPKRLYLITYFNRRLGTWLGITLMLVTRTHNEILWLLCTFMLLSQSDRCNFLISKQQAIIHT